MGGKNHQPTNTRITAASAWLSKAVGEGFLHAIAANNHLEDAIMLGMDKLHIEDLAANLSGTPASHLQATIGALRNSQEALARVDVGFRKLLSVAKVEGYVGNPLVSKLSAMDLGQKFKGVLVRPHINVDVWKAVEQRITTDNILKTLDWEREEFLALVQPTEGLIDVVRKALEIAEKEGGRAFADAVENNVLPLRQYYARVFSLWNNLDAMFLYSALMMTELFYRANAYPSLLDFDPTLDETHAA